MSEEPKKDSIPVGNVVKITLIVLGVVIAVNLVILGIVGLVGYIRYQQVQAQAQQQSEDALDESFHPTEPDGLNINQDLWKAGEDVYSSAHLEVAIYAGENNDPNNRSIPGFPPDCSTFVDFKKMIPKTKDEQKYVSQLDQLIQLYTQFYNVRSKDTFPSSLSSEEIALKNKFVDLDKQIEHEYGFDRMSLVPIY